MKFLEIRPFFLLSLHNMTDSLAPEASSSVSLSAGTSWHN